MSLILIGLKHSGKSSAGQQLAACLQQQFIDVDVLLQQRFAASPQALYTVHGEAAFRRMEQLVIASIQRQHASVIATGGGTVLLAENVQHLRQLGRLIYLQISFSTWYQRLVAHALPAFLRQQDVNEHYQHRHTIYQQAAAVTLPVDNATIAEVVARLKLLVGESYG